ncbi:DNA methyltransferase, partial [Nevskia ramosa]|uniref:DNA methyltransferase n=1 Tax=Nevskia ramosa TaxID=64002 RepID=UPI002356624B
PEHIYAERHREAAKHNRLEFKMTPFSVFEEALLSGFIKRTEQTGFRWQKPESVIAPLLRMTTRPGDLVIDPTAGSGTTGAVAIKLGCAAILSDANATALKTAQKRLHG